MLKLVGDVTASVRVVEAPEQIVLDVAVTDTTGVVSTATNSLPVLVQPLTVVEKE
jgi:hypothetical protein